MGSTDIRNGGGRIDGGVRVNGVFNVYQGVSLDPQIKNNGRCASVNFVEYGKIFQAGMSFNLFRVISCWIK